MHVLQLILLLVIEFTDLYDGIIARKFDLVSEAGATLDPYADSVSRLIIYWALAAQGLVLWYVPLIMALRDITVAYSRIVMAQNNRTVSAKKSGKLKATVQAIGAFFALLGPLSRLEANVAYGAAALIIILPKFAGYRDIVFRKALDARAERSTTPEQRVR